MQEIESVSQVNKVTGSHSFKVRNYSLTKGLGIGKSVSLRIFSIGEHKWVIKFYPDGCKKECSDFLSVFLHLISKSGGHRTSFSFSLLDYTTGQAAYTCGVKSHNFKSTPSNSWGFGKFMRRHFFETSNCLRGDSLTIICDVTIIEDPITCSSIVPSAVAVTIPPSNIQKRLGDFLSSKKGVDVTFEVGGKSFHAHKCVLAASSPVFEAQFFGPMKESKTDKIKISDMEAPVFAAMLHFVYNDTLPEIDKHADIAMTQHLLVAADRYMLEELKWTCEQKLSKNLDMGNVGATLVLAEQHNLTQLKSECLSHLASPKTLKSAMETDDLEHLLQSCPSVIKDIISRMGGDLPALKGRSDI